MEMQASLAENAADAELPDRKVPFPRPLLAVLAAAGMCAVFAFRAQLNNSQRLAAVVGLIVIIGVGYTLSRMIPGRVMTLGVAYVAFFGAFHDGVLINVAAGTVPGLFQKAQPDDVDWYWSPLLATAITTVTIAILAFALGYALVPATAVKGGGSERIRPAFSVDGIGIAMTAGGVLLWFAIAVQTMGLGFIGQSYGTFLAATTNSATPTAYLLISLGMAVIGGSESAQLRRRAMMFFVPFGACAFAVGIRGEVLIPILLWLVLRARQTTIRIRVRALAAAAAALTVGSLVRQTRQSGLSGLNVHSVTASPLDGIAELGGTLRTVVVVQHWHYGGREPYIGWDVYWAPLQRLLVGRILGLPVAATEGDPRVFSQAVLDRIGPIGGSPVAESYRAAGILGVIVVMATIGVVIAWMDSRIRNGRHEAAVGMLAVPLLIWVRNDFTPVVFQVIICCIVLMAAWIIHRARLGKQPGPHMGNPVE